MTSDIIQVFHISDINQFFHISEKIKLKKIQLHILYSYQFLRVSGINHVLHIPVRNKILDASDGNETFRFYSPVCLMMNSHIMSVRQNSDI
jgi:hypothetical protein